MNSASHKTIEVVESSSSVFVIEKYEDNFQKAFSGFYNETTNLGTDAEESSWGLEKWEDQVENAIHFRSICEAKEYLANLDNPDECFITLYGWNEVENMGGNWYPLKEFK